GFLSGHPADHRPRGRREPPPVRDQHRVWQRQHRRREQFGSSRRLRHRPHRRLRHRDDPRLPVRRDLGRQLRLLMATSTQLREWWKNYRCSPDKMVRVAFPGPDRMWNLLVAAEAAQAFEVFAEVMAATGYLFRESAGGTYNCRKISGTDQWSLHS